LSAPNGLWFDASGALYIADSNNARGPICSPSAFTNFAGNGRGQGRWRPATIAQLNKPVGITMDSAGNIYVAM
jgi:sugar lactone lactonase YvrE